MTTSVDSRPLAPSKQQRVMDWLETPSPPPFDTHTRPRLASSPAYIPPTPHNAIKCALSQRNASSTNKKWPHGVVQGGIILDIIEYLRTDSKNIPTDQDLSLWVENSYVRPFVRIGRLDGLVVRDALEAATLVRAHERYSKVFPMPEGSRLPPQQLWVPGLEPIDVPEVREDVMTDIYGIAPREPLEKYEMYKHYEVQAGRSLGTWKDRMGWMREIREAPKPKMEKQRRVVPGKLPVKRLAANKGIPEKRAFEMHVFSNRTDRRRKLNDGSKLTVSQKKLSDAFSTATLARQTGPLSSRLDTPATLIDVTSLTAPLHLHWMSPLVGEDQRQAAGNPNAKRIGLIESRNGGKLKIRNVMLPASSPTGNTTETASAPSDDSFEDLMAGVAKSNRGEGEHEGERESDEENPKSEVQPSSSPVGSLTLLPSSIPMELVLELSDTDSPVDEAVSDSSAESVNENEHEVDYTRESNGTEGLGIDNGNGSVGEEGEGNAGADTESISVKSDSDGGDVDSEYSDAMELSE